MAHHIDRDENERPDRVNDQARLNLLTVIARRKWLIALSLAVGAALGYAYFQRCPRLYESTAQILVIKRLPDEMPIPEVNAHDFARQDYLETHLEVIKSPMIVAEAVQQHQLGSLSGFAGVGNPVSKILSSLTVTRAGSPRRGEGTDVLSLSFRGPVADDCTQILSGVIQSYRGFLNRRYQNINEDFLKLVTQARDALQKELADQEKAYQKFREEAQLLWSGEESRNMHQERLGSIEAARSDLIMRRAETEARLRAIESALEEGPIHRREALAPMFSRSSDRPNATATSESPSSVLEDQMFSLLLQEEKLLEDYGPDHPQVRAIRREIELTRNFYIESVKHELQHSQEQERLLNDLFQREKEQAKKLAVEEVRDQEFRDALARLKLLYEPIVKRLEEILLVKDHGGYDAEVIAPPTAKQVAPKPLQIFTVAPILGLLVGVGLAYLIEMQDKTLRTPEEVRRCLGVPVVGQIPMVQKSAQTGTPSESDGGALDPMLWVYHRPRSREAEAIRGVRTALTFSTRGEGYKVIQITSPKPSDGKSLLAANLAISFAQSGKKTLLIDAEFRAPCQHKLFGLKTKVGLASVLTDGAELADAVQQSPATGLWVLASGPLPPNPAELLSSSRFEELLHLVREQYDVVLLDTAPLLMVTDPCAIAARVDGVVLAIRIAKTNRPEAELANEILGTPAANVIGVVVNGVERTAGYQYYYGSDNSGRSPSFSDSTQGIDDGASLHRA